MQVFSKGEAAFIYAAFIYSERGGFNEKIRSPSLLIIITITNGPSTSAGSESV